MESLEISVSAFSIRTHVVPVFPSALGPHMGARIECLNEKKKAMIVRSSAFECTPPSSRRVIVFLRRRGRAAQGKRSRLRTDENDRKADESRICRTRIALHTWSGLIESPRIWCQCIESITNSLNTCLANELLEVGKGP